MRLLNCDNYQFILITSTEVLVQEIVWTIRFTKAKTCFEGDEQQLK